MDFKKTELINNLIDIYGQLLTDNQLNVMKLYYMDDLTLSEIAENSNVSRSAIFDTIKKTTTILQHYESKLHLLEKENMKNKLIDESKKLSKQEIIDRLKNI